MRVVLIEHDNGRIMYVSTAVYNLEPDPQLEGLYIATSTDKKSLEKHYEIKKLTDTVYRDNTGMYCLTEDHPFFNAPMLNKIATVNKLDNYHIISHLLAGVRYLVKQSMYAASAAYSKHNFKHK